MNNKLVSFTKILLDFMFYSGLLVTILVPFILKEYGNFNPYFAANVIPLSMILSPPAFLPC